VIYPYCLSKLQLDGNGDLVKGTFLVTAKSEIPKPGGFAHFGASPKGLELKAVDLKPISRPGEGVICDAVVRSASATSQLTTKTNWNLPRRN